MIARILAVAAVAATTLALTATAPAQQPVAPSAEKQRMTALGVEHKTARALYEHFKQEANGGPGADLARRARLDGHLDARSKPVLLGSRPRLADRAADGQADAGARALLRDKLDKIGRGIEFDPLSNCEPAGMPRWLVEPFLKEFVVTPAQTYLINEMQNEMRRVYTDGRDHPSEADAYPLWEGDSIGFWDGNKLVIHTSQMRAGQYQRIQPFYTEQVETVEVWQKTDPTTMVVDVWAFDPPALAEPWYTRQVYKQLSNDDLSLRIRYWNCGENQNNAVEQTDTGTSDFSNFTFTDKDDQ